MMNTTHDNLIDATFALLAEATYGASNAAIPQIIVPTTVFDALRNVLTQCTAQWNAFLSLNNEYSSVISAALNVLNRAEADDDDVFIPEHLYDNLREYAIQYVRLIDPQSPLLCE